MRPCQLLRGDRVQRWAHARKVPGPRHPQPGRPLLRCHAAPSSSDSTSAASGPSSNTIASLQSLLGESDVTSTSGSETDTSGSTDLQPWWAARPKQAAPPRQTYINNKSPGSPGRFVMSEDFLRLGELRIGRKTQLDGQLELPKVQPVWCFVLLLVNVACYATYTNVSLFQGPEAARDFISGLWVSPLMLTETTGPATLHALAATCMAPGPVELLFTLWALALVAPRAESALGYGAFLYIYAVSGLAGALVQVTLMAGYTGDTHIGACGAGAAILGVLGSLAAHYVTNGRVETQAASWRANSTSTPSELSDASTPLASTSAPTTAPLSLHKSEDSTLPTRQQSQQRAALVQAACLTVVSLSLAAMQHLEGHPSDPGGGAGQWGEVAGVMGVWAQLTGLGTGFLLGKAMGPQYVVQRELHLDEGSMFIPDDAKDMLVVLDRTSGFQQGVAAVTSLTALGVAWSLMHAWLM